MPESDLALLIRAAESAAETATRYIGGPLDSREKPDGQGPVTEADLATNATLEQILRAARPDYGWLSEESPDTAARHQSPMLFIVDPIDGTRSFIEGAETWAHSLAVCDAGRITAACIFLPLKDRLYTASAGGGAALNGTPIAARPPRALDGANVLVTKAGLDARHWPEGVPALTRHHRPSIAYRMALVAEGRFDAMLTFRDTWEWDCAAGALLCAEAGAGVTDRAGRPLTFNTASARVAGVRVNG